MASLPRQPHPPWTIAPRRPLRGAIASAIANECAWIATIARNRDAAVAVHRVRQSTKRLRALARLLRPCAGDELYKSWNTTLRDLARSLANERDADVWVATYRRLARSNIKIPRVGRDDAAKLLQKVAEGIFIFNETWQRSLPKRISRESIRLGLRRSFRRAKQQYKIALDDTNSETLHELRKRLKTVRAQVELLENVFEARSRDAISSWLKKTDILSKTLGEEHDLATFLIIKDQLKKGAVSERICEKAGRKREKLKTESLACAKDIFELDPSERFWDRL
ncbi:MAG: CHAD domain-containing protein [Planctomycetota bacterium]